MNAPPAPRPEEIVHPIDLRSDTVTKPSEAMRAAMAHAPVGDDQYGEDPTTGSLQERVAAMLGKEVALFVPSGTMANQIALKVLTQPGDDVVIGADSHVAAHEAGAAAANAGVQFTIVGDRGLFTADQVARAIKPRAHLTALASTLVIVENTHNRGGGAVFPQADIEAIAGVARDAGVSTYLDGARLLNASVASGLSPAVLSGPFDLVSIALSKGLGCPMGSVLAGDARLISKAVRVRKMFGGALRQSGIVAAAGLFALEHNIARLEADHANAKRLASRLSDQPGISLDMSRVQTNIVVFTLAEDGPDAAAFARAARERGVLVTVFGPRIIRLVTHMGVSADDCEAAGEILSDLCRNGAGAR